MESSLLAALQFPNAFFQDFQIRRMLNTHFGQLGANPRSFPLLDNELVPFFSWLCTQFPHAGKGGQAVSLSVLFKVANLHGTSCLRSRGGC